jgi:tetratricopeptide (TPR) repeat protein
MGRTRLVCLILVLVTVSVYLPVREYGFLLYDDPNYVSENKIVQSGLTWAGIKWAFTTFHASNWHPLTWLSHMLDCQLFGPSPGAHHLINVLFHAANAVVLLILLFRMTGAFAPAAFVAALFALHPLHVESVAWISERKDVLSTLFGLLALMAYWRYTKRNQPRQLWLALMFYALSLMAKPMLVTLPFVMLLLDWWPLRRVSSSDSRVPSWKGLFVEKAPFFLLSAVSCVLTFLAQRGEAVAPLEQLPVATRLANAAASYVRYLAKTIWPIDLAVPYPMLSGPPWPLVLTAVILLAATSLYIWTVRMRRPYLLVGWLWYLGTLVPVIGLVQVGGQAMADRYSYFPLLGIFVAVAFAFKDLLVRFRIGAAVPATAAALILVACLVVTRHQLQFWRDSESLFTHSLAVTEDNPYAHINLGVLLEEEGRNDKALEHYREAVRIAPHIPALHNNLANLLDKMGKADEALTQYQEALRLQPDAPAVHLNLAASLVKLGRYDEAIQHYIEAARLTPSDPRPHYMMGKAKQLQDRSAEAVGHFRNALRVDSNDVKAIVQLARALASDKDPAVRNGPEAVVLAERANTLTGGGQPYVLDTLAMAYAEAGRFNDAQQAVQKAITITLEMKEEEAVAEMQERLRVYQLQQPYREPSPKSE